MAYSKMILCKYIFILSTCWTFKIASSETTLIDTSPLKNIANVSYAQENVKRSSVLFPRLDFDQWKPLTGRGDPLRNDPTYDYEPPVLERVHYWADDPRLERDHLPQRKSEILILGVSSRKPSVTSRQPPPRRHYRPQSTKYETFAYKLSEHYPMTILVPPPPPPIGYKPMLFGPAEQNSLELPNLITPVSELPKKSNLSRPFSTNAEHETSLYSLQEANLIFQSSTTNHNWIFDDNKTKSTPVVNEYDNTGSTKQISGTDATHDSYNFISNDHIETTKPPPYFFYKPMLSESPPSLPINNLFPSAMLTAPPQPPVEASTDIPTTLFSSVTTTDLPVFTDFHDDDTETTSENSDNDDMPSTSFVSSNTNTQTNVYDMLSPMMTMPLINGAEKPDNNYNLHATENHEVFKNYDIEDLLAIDNRKPLIPEMFKESPTAIHKFKDQKHKNIYEKKISVSTLDPYLHMRYTTPLPTIATSTDTMETTKLNAESVTLPMHLIIQGHSKVKTYGTQTKKTHDNDTSWNEITKPNETDEVKHLHPIKQKPHKVEKTSDTTRKGKVHSLKSLIDKGQGSIEIQEADLGIKYDISDGSDVPLEVYRKGIIINNEESNDYKAKNKTRTKRQIDLEDILPFDEDTLEEYVYNFLKSRRNDTGITGLIAQAITGKTGAVLDELEDDDEEER